MKQNSKRYAITSKKQRIKKKIIELNDSNDVYCVEYSDVTGGVLVVQRNQIKEILGQKLITLHNDKKELLTYINNINPACKKKTYVKLVRVIGGVECVPGGVLVSARVVV